MLTSLPNLLTLSRIVIIPVLIALFFIDGALAHWIALVLYILAALSDWLDGYLARRQKQVSAIGKFLDPIADKLLVGALLLALAGFGHISTLGLIPAIVILCREILISGLREFLAGFEMPMPVSYLAKWKTTVQMVALGFLIVREASLFGLSAQMIGEAGLWIAAILTAVTGYQYFSRGVAHVLATDQPKAGSAPVEPAKPDGR